MLFRESCICFAKPNTKSIYTEPANQIAETGTPRFKNGTQRRTVSHFRQTGVNIYVRFKMVI